VAQESLCLAQATNMLEPLSIGIPKALGHFPSCHETRKYVTMNYSS
jgi:hypothetical protein